MPKTGSPWQKRELILLKIGLVFKLNGFLTARRELRPGSFFFFHLIIVIISCFFFSKYLEKFRSRALIDILILEVHSGVKSFVGGKKSGFLREKKKLIEWYKIEFLVY